MNILSSYLTGLLILAYFILLQTHVSAWTIQEVPIELPKKEGSINFDLEIGGINSYGLKLFKQKNYVGAADKFYKALELAKQLRAPSKGILYYNLALSLYNSGKHQEAIRSFYSARKFARGNKKILNSELLKLYKCGFNPSATCEEKLPLSMSMEGLH